MVTILLEIVENFELKLQRKLTEEEYKIVKRMVEKQMKGK